LARGCLYDLALTGVETRDAIIAMVSALLIGSASETSKVPSSKGIAGSPSLRRDPGNGMLILPSPPLERLGEHHQGGETARYRLRSGR
jgi:hypothetical protein